MEHFVNIKDVPEFPLCKSDDERYKNIEKYLEAGAIAKEDLFIGSWYIGQSRNTEIAQWMNNKFYFIRHKFGSYYVDSIPHFFDNVETDVFIPIKRIIL